MHNQNHLAPRRVTLGNTVTARAGPGGTELHSRESYQLNVSRSHSSPILEGPPAREVYRRHRHLAAGGRALVLSTYGLVEPPAHDGAQRCTYPAVTALRRRQLPDFIISENTDAHSGGLDPLSREPHIAEAQTIVP